MTSTDSGTSQPHPPRRPILVWVVFLFYAYVSVSVCIDYSRGYTVLLRGQRIPLPSSAVEKGLRATVIALSILSAFELFRLRNAAVPCFMAAWIARAMFTIYDIAGSVRGRHPLFMSALALISLAVFTTLLVYAEYLRKKGVLQPGV